MFTYAIPRIRKRTSFYNGIIFQNFYVEMKFMGLYGTDPIRRRVCMENKATGELNIFLTCHAEFS
jgi:hypothetical protein